MYIGVFTSNFIPVWNIGKYSQISHSNYGWSVQGVFYVFSNDEGLGLEVFYYQLISDIHKPDNEYYEHEYIRLKTNAKSPKDHVSPVKL